MCGIAGILSFGGTHDLCATVRAMTRALRHRGPDAEGHLQSGAVVFGHARLSIIDIAGGAQPMSTPDGSSCISFNGEIFNHVELRADLERRGARFRTRSDTEVILQAYALDGPRC